MNENSSLKTSLPENLTGTKETTNEKIPKNIGQFIMGKKRFFQV